MIKLFTTIWLKLAIVLCFIFAGKTLYAGEENQMAHMDLAVSFDLEQSILRGTARLALPPGENVALHVDGLLITGALLNQAGRENLTLTPGEGAVISVPALSSPQTILLSYEKKVNNTFLNSISSEAIVLTSGWHPLPDRKVTFALEARVPEDFTAISESDYFPAKREGGASHFSFSQPVQSISFAAAPYEVKKKEVRQGLTVYTLFFPEDSGLADEYLDSAAAYLSRYESSIGQFPYNHYGIVANVQPTGFGIPTFTLLGRQVIRLPFITRTSLGHEILHSWFGNSIDIAPQSGNWCEGLTTYLADIAYREEAGEGPAARKETIQNYLNYVVPSTPPLQEFVSAGHSRLSDRQQRAVGYGRAALLFHELHQLVGSTQFETAIRQFYQDFIGRSASWDDIQMVFEQVSGRSLKDFFSQRLTTNDLPSLAVSNIAVQHDVDSAKLSFTIVQEQAQPFEIPLHYVVKTLAGSTGYSELISGAETRISVELDGLPLGLSLDPGFDIMRNLSAAEQTPTLSGLFGAEHGYIILADANQKEIFEPFFQLTDNMNWHVEAAADVTPEELRDHNVIFLGTESVLSRSLFATPPHPGNGFTFDVRFNPIDRGRLVGLVSSANAAETAAVVNRLRHYGKYSFLHFDSGRIQEKRIATTANGIDVTINDLPSGTATPPLNSFSQLVEELGKKRVIYIGEQHTSRADHLLQAMLIEALYQQNKELVIGMEMFPRSSQQALDDYINDPSMTEAEFLKKSDYYNVWGYDFRLFRPIFSFARKHGVPIRGLNIDRSIVSTIFKSGFPGELTEEELAAIPTDRDLDMDGYVERLSATHGMHDSATRSAGSLAGFVQAQSIWDEGMAESIHDYLAERPSTTMIVLAGSQHTRKDSGIPPRLARRLDVPQASLINLATSRISGELLQRTTDYLFMLEAEDFPPQGKIGIVLQKLDDPQSPGLQVIEINANSNSIAAGLQVRDLLVRINGHEINSMFDVRSAMLGRLVGERIDIVVMREGPESAEELQLEVELFNPQPVKPHP